MNFPIVACHISVFNGPLRRTGTRVFRRFNITICVVAALGFLLHVSDAHARKWVDKTGQFSVEADYVELKDGKVVLKKSDGKAISVPLGRLSDADQKYVATLQNQPTPAADGSATTDNHGGKYVTFPNSGIKLAEPKGFFEVENFEGFHQENTQASVIAQKIPDPYAEAVLAFSAKRLAESGMTLRAKEAVNIDGHGGILLSVLQSADGTDYAKWILVFGTNKETKIVTAMCPTLHEAKLFAALKSVVLTAKPVE